MRGAATVARPGRRRRAPVAPRRPPHLPRAAPRRRHLSPAGCGPSGSPSPPSRWKQGSEQPGPESRRRISDLDHVLDRLLMELYPDQVGVWLTSPNPHLGSARPVDVLELRGAAAVLPAVDALAQGTVSYTHLTLPTI